MRTALCLAALVALSPSASAESLILTRATELPDRLVVIPEFANSNAPTTWKVRDGEEANRTPNFDDGWLVLGYRNVGAPPVPHWVPGSSFAVPDDGVPNFELITAINGLNVLHMDMSEFLAAGDASVQVILPGSPGPVEELTFLSPHLGTVVKAPEPASWLMLGAVVPLCWRRPVNP
jgi:hypothetical protein